jgi:hypothetical protein
LVDLLERGGAMKKTAMFAGAAALAMLAPTGSSYAQDGLAGIHDWVRIGGKTCMVDHFHDGSGTGATKNQALASAIRAWQDFTSWEYSNRWGRYSNAVSKSQSCSGGPGNFSCNVSARPCRY